MLCGPQCFNIDWGFAPAYCSPTYCMIAETAASETRHKLKSLLSKYKLSLLKEKDKDTFSLVKMLWGKKHFAVRKMRKHQNQSYFSHMTGYYCIKGIVQVIEGEVPKKRL